MKQFQYMSDTFVGQVVTLRSGSPLMTVRRLFPESSSVEVVWIDGNGEHAWDFPILCLNVGCQGEPTPCT